MKHCQEEKEKRKEKKEKCTVEARERKTHDEHETKAIQTNVPNTYSATDTHKTYKREGGRDGTIHPSLCINSSFFVDDTIRVCRSLLPFSL